MLTRFGVKRYAGRRVTISFWYDAFSLPIKLSYAFSIFLKFIYLFFRQRERGRAQKQGRGRERGRERIPSRLHTGRRDWHRAQSHDCEIMTWAEINSQTPANWVMRAPKYIHIFDLVIPFLRISFKKRTGEVDKDNFARVGYSLSVVYNSEELEGV